MNTQTDTTAIRDNLTAAGELYDEAIATQDVPLRMALQWSALECLEHCLTGLEEEGAQVPGALWAPLARARGFFVVPPRFVSPADTPRPTLRQPLALADYANALAVIKNLREGIANLLGFSFVLEVED